MCGRYVFWDEKNQRWQRLIEQARQKFAEKDFEEVSLTEVFPGTQAFAGIYIPARDTHVMRIMKWGYPRSTGSPVINGRSETCFSSRFFAGSIPCVLPASYYYEWTKSPRVRYAFRIADECMYLGGLARQFADGWHFVILTEEARGEARTVHDRMPLAFTYEDAKKWCASEHPTSLYSLSVSERFIEKA
ncbi:MAG: SOS response-associated peptidase family protein [Solobacterium sp.]|nr:SOS response-associated peptidase family protein [Solobacterium sp.]